MRARTAIRSMPRKQLHHGSIQVAPLSQPIAYGRLSFHARDNRLFGQRNIKHLIARWLAVTLSNRVLVIISKVSRQTPAARASPREDDDAGRDAFAALRPGD